MWPGSGDRIPEEMSSIPIPIAIPIPNKTPAEASRPDTTRIDGEPGRPALTARVGIGIGIGIGIENEGGSYQRQRQSWAGNVQ